MNPQFRKSLLGKLNDTCFRAFEGAVQVCASRGNYTVEVEHWLLKLVEIPNTDLAALFRYFEVDTSRLIRDLTRSIEGLKRGNERDPALSLYIVNWMSEAWLMASIQYHSQRIRSGHLLCALLSSESIGRQASQASAEFSKVSLERLVKDLPDIVANTAEAAQDLAAVPSMGAPGKPGVAQADSKTPALDQFTNDLTVRAMKGEVDPVLGRDAEIRQIIDILTRRRQNNPILTGEAGVGKTAVVEGFARRVVAGDVPPSLKGVSVRALDIGLLQAGAGVRGEFENRLKSVIDEVKKSPQPVILFIDEAHTLIGAGGGAGQADAANLLKPALARGELRSIAATTWAEYKKYFEKDAALARRFQVVKVEEPTQEVAVQMMQGLVDTLEKHHKVRILDEAVLDAVKLSSRYLSGRQLPDKSVSLLDTACARVWLSQTATPPAIEDCRRRISQGMVSLEILRRENVTGIDHRERLEELERSKASAESELKALEARWAEEAKLVGEILKIQGRLVAGLKEPSVDGTAGAATGAQAQDKSSQLPPSAAQTDSATIKVPPPEAASPGGGLGSQQLPSAEDLQTAQKDQDGAGGDRVAAAFISPRLPCGPALHASRKDTKDLQRFSDELKRVQGEDPLVQVCVDSQSVAEVVSGWTGIPVGRMVTDEINTVLSLKEMMERRIIGQSHALDAMAQRIRTARANLTDPRRPIGVFLMVGPSGVGKTETAIVLAELLYGGDQNMTVINMSEFKEEHKVSLLMGSPPGYVGYGEGGVLTEAVRRRPYSVVLLDEMEKAHPGVQDIFYQVFDKGTLRDGEGRDIDFKNTVIIMTSNAGTELITKLCADPETKPDPVGLGEALHPELLKTFKAAFLGRVTLVPYYPLTEDVMHKIIELQLDRIGRRVKENYKASFAYAPEVVSCIAARCRETESGARNVDHILTRSLLPELSKEFLSRIGGGVRIARVEVGVNAEGAFVYSLD